MRRKIGKDGRNVFSTAGDDEERSTIFAISSSRGSTAQLSMHMHVGLYSYVFRDTRRVEVVDGVAVSCLSHEHIIISVERDTPAPRSSTTP